MTKPRGGTSDPGPALAERLASMSIAEIDAMSDREVAERFQLRHRRHHRAALRSRQPAEFLPGILIPVHAEHHLQTIANMLYG